MCFFLCVFSCLCEGCNEVCDVVLCVCGAYSEGRNEVCDVVLGFCGFSSEGGTEFCDLVCVFVVLTVMVFMRFVTGFLRLWLLYWGL